MNNAVVILGSGGHAKVLLDAVRQLGMTVLGYAAPAPNNDAPWRDLPYLGDDAALLRNPPRALLVNGVGSISPASPRKDVFRKFKAAGFSFAAVVHPRAVVSPLASVGEGAQIMAGAVVQAGTVVGENAIVNTGAIVDHDCRVAAHAHLAPGSALSGGVEVGECALVGTGAAVIQNVKIGENVTVGAGAIVTRDVPAGATVVKANKILQESPES